MHHPIAQFTEVSFTYGEEVVLDRVSVTIPEGAFVGIVGPSGAGKTTMLKLMAGVIKPSAGRLRLGHDGQPVRMAVVPQLETIDWNFPITVEEIVLLGRAAESGWKPWAPKAVRAEARSLLEKLGIGHLAHRHIRNLSGGQQQRAFIARALLRRPDLLLLDEPTAGVDVKTRHDILHLLHSLNHEGIAIALTTHDLNAVAAHLPSLVCIRRKVIAVGRPSDVLTPPVLRDLYGAEMVVVQKDGMVLISDLPSAVRDTHERTGHPEDIPLAHFGDVPAPHEHDAGSDHRHHAEGGE